MNVDEALRQFANAQEMPRVALQWALDHWEAAAPRFIARLRAFAASPAARDEIAEDEILFIVHLCGEMRDARAYAPLCRLIGESEEAIAFLGDAVTETLGGILINVCDGDPHPLMGAISRRAATNLRVLRRSRRSAGSRASGRFSATKRCAPISRGCGSK